MKNKELCRAYGELLECAGLSNLGYSAAGGERATRSKKLGCNKPAQVFLRV